MVWACGLNGNGQLGDGTNTDKNTPVQVSGVTDITAIAAGGDHSLFLKNDGTVWACGLNGNGQLGDGTNTDKNTPVQISNPPLCNVATKINEYGLDENILVYPNPSNGHLEIDIKDLELTNAVLKIYNVLGEVVLKSFILKPISQINLFNQPKGIYFLKLK